MCTKGFNIFVQNYAQPWFQLTDWQPYAISDVAAALKTLQDFLEATLPEYVDSSYGDFLEFNGVPEPLEEYIDDITEEVFWDDGPVMKWEVLDRIHLGDENHAMRVEDHLDLLKDSMDDSSWMYANRSCIAAWRRSACEHFSVCEDFRRILTMYAAVMEALGFPEHAPCLRTIADRAPPRDETSRTILRYGFHLREGLSQRPVKYNANARIL